LVGLRCRAAQISRRRSSTALPPSSWERHLGDSPLHFGRCPV